MGFSSDFGGLYELLIHRAGHSVQKLLTIIIVIILEASDSVLEGVKSSWRDDETITPNRQGPIPSLTRVPGHLLRTAAHESQEAALPAVALAQHTLHRLPLRVMAKGKEACIQALPNPARPTSLALACSALTHVGLLCDPGQVPSPL